MSLYIQDQIDFLIYEKGESITINGIPQIAIIEYTDNRDVEEIKLITRELLKRGDIIIINNHNYLITNEINLKRFDSYYKAYVQSCNYNIKFNFNGVVKEFYSIIASKIFDTTQNKYFELAEGTIQVTLQDITDSKSIILGQRFIKMGSPWKITGLDKTKTGLIVLTCSLDLIIPTEDDMDNEIANRWKYETKHVYTIETTNIDTSTEKGKTVQFVVTVKNNDVVVTNPTIVYTSNDSNCSVDISGLITANAIGTSTITASYTTPDGTVKSISITITVVEPTSIHNYSMTITGLDTIIQGNYESYTAEIKDNNVLVIDKTVIWSLLNELGDVLLDATIATLGNITGTGCEINGLKMGEYGTLRCTLSIEGQSDIIYNKEIQFIGGW